MKKTSAFSLIELMIVVAIISFLAAIAFPSYTQFIIKANRADAQDVLTKTMFEMERYYTRERSYTTTLGEGGLGLASTRSSEGLYNISAMACTSTIIQRCVQLSAAPVTGTAQAGDFTFSLDSRGRRTTTNSGGLVEAGWDRP